jgi:hypothetical protein
MLTALYFEAYLILMALSRFSYQVIDSVEGVNSCTLFKTGGKRTMNARSSDWVVAKVSFKVYLETPCHFYEDSKPYRYSILACAGVRDFRRAIRNGSRCCQVRESKKFEAVFTIIKLQN